MTRRIASLLSGATLCIALAAHAAPVRIALRPTVALPGTTYALGDIADIESTDAALSKRLAGIQIGMLPRQAYTDSAARHQIEAIVRQQVMLADVEWSG